jgi:hypothetical protein
MRFEGDATEYTLPPARANQLNGWQYVYTVTAFDGGDPDNNVESLESSRLQNARRVIPGSTPDAAASSEPCVYPNPYYTQAQWDGSGERERKLYFCNLPARAEIRVYTMTGDLVRRMNHDAPPSNGSVIQWFSRYADGTQVMSGGEHAWDLISDSDQAIATGLYLFTVGISTRVISNEGNSSSSNKRGVRFMKLFVPIQRPLLITVLPEFPRGANSQRHADHSGIQVRPSRHARGRWSEFTARGRHHPPRHGRGYAARVSHRADPTLFALGNAFTLLHHPIPPVAHGAGINMRASDSTPAKPHWSRHRHGLCRARHGVVTQYFTTTQFDVGVVSGKGMRM